MRGTLSLKQVNGSHAEVSAIVSWQVKLRQAMFDAVTEDDVKEIVRAHVDAAKKGDAAAIRFVTDVLLGSKQAVTLVQNNQYGVEEAARDELRRNGRGI